MHVERADFVAVPARDGLRQRELSVETLGLRPDDRALDTFEDPEGNDLMLHRRYAP